MKYYAAPMEGVTGYVYRNAHHHYYPGIEKYFSPFLTPKKKKGMNSKETNDILPEHNTGIRLVPQIMTNHADHFVSLAGILSEYGYDEINLNLGCPSGTVVSKGKGCGFLKDRDVLHRFFEETMVKMEQAGLSSMKVSVKTRLGVDDPLEILPLMDIYNEYPLSEVIVHARIHKDFYKNPVNHEAFRAGLMRCQHPVCYNGDLFTAEDISRFSEEFPDVDCVMLARGMISNPELCRLRSVSENEDSIRRFFAFHEEVLNGYIEIMSGERNVLFKMKELWNYMGVNFPGQEKIMKKIKKANNLMEYNRAVAALSYQKDGEK